MKYYYTTTKPLSAIEIIDQEIAEYEDRQEAKEWVEKNLRDPKEVIKDYSRRQNRMKIQKDWKNSIKKVEEIMEEQLKTLKKLKELREENNDKEQE